MQSRGRPTGLVEFAHDHEAKTYSEQRDRRPTRDHAPVLSRMTADCRRSVPER